jgi:hypothetical protein
MLNPLINSLSPSTKSKGLRFDSIKDKNPHKINQTKSTSTDCSSSEMRKNLFLKVNILITTKKIVTSKERFWSILRSLPNFENLLVLLHPVKITQ